MTPRDVLDLSINELNDHLTVMGEGELQKLLRLELKTKKRPYVVKRIYSRWHKLRGARELLEIMNDLDLSKKRLAGQEG